MEEGLTPLLNTPLSLARYQREEEKREGLTPLSYSTPPSLGKGRGSQGDRLLDNLRGLN